MHGLHNIVFVIIVYAAHVFANRAKNKPHLVKIKPHRSQLTTVYM